MITFQDRVRGVLLSTALGDAMGAPVEKLSYQQIYQQYTRIENLRTKWYKDDLKEEERMGKQRGNGIVTDDTLMTIALINVYLKEKRHLDAYDVGNEFVKEIAFRKKYIPEFGKEGMLIERLFYPEKYIFQRHVLANCEPREAGIGNMINCGAAMYIAPIGIVNAGDPKAAYDEAILFAMGHQSSYGLEAAGVLAACVAKAFDEQASIEDIVRTSLTFAKDGTKQAIEALTNTARELKVNRLDKKLVANCFHEILSNFSPMKDQVHRHFDKVGVPSNHYTPSRLFSIEELPIALAYIVLNDGDYYASILDGVNSGRDTDSIGVMIGVILGAKYGYQVIHEEDHTLLESANKINFIELADQFSAVASDLIRKDFLLFESRKRQLAKMGLEME
jgi:ADP-ribosylglycohydrolase